MTCRSSRRRSSTFGRRRYRARGAGRCRAQHRRLVRGRARRAVARRLGHRRRRRRCRVGLITGFFVPLGSPPAAETDGPVGAALLARGLAADRHSVPAGHRRAVPQRLRGRIGGGRRRRGAGRLRSPIGAPLDRADRDLARRRDHPCDLDRTLRAQRRRRPAQHARSGHQRLYRTARRAVRGRAVGYDRGRRRRQRDRDGRPAARADRAAMSSMARRSPASPRRIT